MPFLNSLSRGRLIIQFIIDFPKYIPQEKKENLIEILS